jgi:hypothetical protein
VFALSGRMTRQAAIRLSLLVFFGLAGSAADSPPATKSLCDILLDYDKYQGTIIELEADYKRGRELQGLFEPGCSKPLIIRGTRWPMAVSLRFPDGGFVGGSPVNRDSFKALETAGNKAADNKGLRVIVKGRLNSSSENRFYVNRDGQRKHLGFGHLGVFPYQIELVEVVKIGTLGAEMDKAK